MNHAIHWAMHLVMYFDDLGKELVNPSGLQYQIEEHLCRPGCFKISFLFRILVMKYGHWEMVTLNNPSNSKHINLFNKGVTSFE